MSKYTYTFDPGHGWVSVSHDEILRLGIKEKISPYSYMNATRVFLEEDDDLTLFMKTKNDLNEPVELIVNYVNNTYIRSLRNYQSDFVGIKLKIGSMILLWNDIQTPITLVTNKRYVTEFGQIPKSNPYRYIKKVIKE